jgi:hypothetical protein
MLLMHQELVLYKLVWATVAEVLPVQINHQKLQNTNP